MKKIYLLGILWCSLHSIASQPLVFENNLKIAFEKAKMEHKPVFIEYYNSSCHVCMRVSQLFNNNEKLIDFYSKNFINYRTDFHHMSPVDSLFMINTNLHFTSVPYFMFFNSNQELLHVSAINVDAEKLLTVGMNAFNPNERTNTLESKYNKGDRTIKTLYAYSQLVQLYNNDSLTTILANDLYKSFPKTDLGNKKSYLITKGCVNDIENGFFTFWINNMDKLTGFETGKNAGKELETLSEIVRKSIYSKKSQQWDLLKIEKVKQYVVLTGLSKNPDVFFWELQTRLLIDQGKSDEALLIGSRKINEDKTAIKANLSVLRHFITTLKSKEDLKTVKSWLDMQTLNATDIDDKAEIYYLEILYYTKTDQKTKAQEILTSAQKYYNENKLDIKELNKFNL